MSSSVFHAAIVTKPSPLTRALDQLAKAPPLNTKTKNVLITLGVILALGAIATAIAAGLGHGNLEQGFKQMGEGFKIAGNHISEHAKAYAFGAGLTLVALILGTIKYKHHVKQQKILEMNKAIESRTKARISDIVAKAMEVEVEDHATIDPTAPKSFDEEFAQWQAKQPKKETLRAGAGMSSSSSSSSSSTSGAGGTIARMSDSSSSAGMSMESARDKWLGVHEDAVTRGIT